MAKSKTFVCNWVASQVSELMLNDYKEQGFLAETEAATCQVPMGERIPEPHAEEVIVFTDHLLRGFFPPGSKFF